MGGMVPIPHGAVCARLLPAVMEANLKSAKSQNLKYIISKYDEVAQLLTGESNARSEEGVQWAQQMVEKLNIPSLSAFGLTPDDFPVLVEKAKKASSMKGNPVVLSDESLMLILEKSI
jgi:alcohol dehydrogenase class IV